MSHIVYHAMLKEDIWKQVSVHSWPVVVTGGGESFISLHHPQVFIGVAPLVHFGPNSSGNIGRY